MAAERESPGIADYVVTALSPTLIMLMVGSLVFFLVEVLYAGQYSSRLLYTLFFFVLATVLVARISIQYDAGRALIYGIALAVVTYIAILSYVEYPKGWLRAWGWLVNLGLMALVWWSAHKLTWDCTHIDEKQNSSGRGLLNAAGLSADEEAKESVSREQSKNVGEPPTGSPNPSRQASESEVKKKKKKTKKSQYDSRLWNWIEKYKVHRESQRAKGHTPGVWVIYFALAALPLFALGQSLIDADDDKRRRAAFLQMAVYIASALGLLVTTSLLGVRRYLRQRKAKIPVAMTASWLGLGAILIALFLILGAFLPRPHSEVPWFGIERAGKSDRSASKNSQLSDSAGKGEGRGGNQTKAGDGSASGKGGQLNGGTKGEKGSGKGNKGKGTSGEKGKGDGGDKKDDEGKNGSGNRDPEERESQQGNDSKEEGTADSDNSSRSSSQLSETLAKVAGVVKWIVFAIIVLLIIFALFFGALKYLAPFTDWARRWLDGIRNWWANLFGKSKANANRKTEAEEVPLAPPRPPPFHAYSNPFVDGTAEDRDPAELIAYTFEALDAWAWDRDAGREPTETPLEFARRLGEAFPDHADAFTKLATLYTRMAYSTLPLPKDALTLLEEAWEQMVHGAVVGA